MLSPLGVSNVSDKKTPRVGLEPTTTRLTAECSTIELSRNKVHNIYLQNFTQKSDSFQPFGQALKRLVTVSSMCYHTSTSALSTSYSSRDLTSLWKGYLILGGTSRLDAFSVYSFRTWLPGDAIGMTAGTPVVRPARSSRTKASSPQISYARAG